MEETKELSPAVENKEETQKAFDVSKEEKKEPETQELDIIVEMEGAFAFSRKYQVQIPEVFVDNRPEVDRICQEMFEKIAECLRTGSGSRFIPEDLQEK